MKKFITAFNRTEKNIRDCNLVEFKKPSQVKQSLAYACDIHTIYDNFCKSGRLPLNGQKPLYDENFVNYDSLIEAQKLVDEASKYFSGLPSEIKLHYGNSLSHFIKGLNNKDDFLIKSGVLNLVSSESTQVDINSTQVDINSPVSASVSQVDAPVSAPVSQVNTASTD